jgi:hypothetical protein
MGPCKKFPVDHPPQRRGKDAGRSSENSGQSQVREDQTPSKLLQRLQETEIGSGEEVAYGGLSRTIGQDREQTSLGGGNRHGSIILIR